MSRFTPHTALAPRRRAVLSAALAGLTAVAACAPRTAPAPVAPSGPPLDRARPPALGAPAPLKTPPVVTRELPNGLRLVVVEQHELPLADFVLLVRSGAEMDPAATPGVASLAAALLDEGTTTRDALAIADQQAYLGVRIGAGAGWDASTVSLHAPVAQLDSALALFADVVLRPTFPEQEFTRVRAERVTELIQLKDRPRAIADRAFAQVLYGDAHPYGRPLTGTEASVQRITRDDLSRFYRTFYRPNNATLIVVGDVRPDDVERRARALFGGWERAEVPPASYPAPPAARPATVYLIDKQRAPQSSVRIGLVGVPRATPDYFPLQVMNTVLGGSFTSRLNQNLRETRGYTYGASSGFAMRRAAGPFLAAAEVTGGKTDSALVEFMKELRSIRDTVPVTELDKAKRYLQLGLPADLESSGQIASQMVPIVLHGLPLNFFDTYVQRVEGVTQADVQRVAREYVDPSRVAVVVVGDRASIEAGLKAINVGPVEIRDLSGAPVRP
ncbi:MAG TPA: pitrilysin family protein [Gemmatimonadaceae bacterium]|nr:pitrilysin family protein [Gemmatimonadaceae bacterium]